MRKMPWRSEVAFLIFRAVLLRPQKFKLFRSITMHCDCGLVSGWSKEMPRLERALLQINLSLIGVRKTSLGKLIGILAADFHAEKGL